MGNNLESNIVEVLKEVAKDVRSIRNSGSGAIATYDDIKHALNVKGYYCKDSTLSSVLGDDVLCGIYTLDGSEALVYRPSKVKFDYVSIV